VKVRFVWVPEHYGSVALVRKLLEENVVILGALNLDMIGEKQTLTNSVLNFIRPPVLLLSEFEAHAFKNFFTSLGTGWGLTTSSRKPLLRFELKTYEAGSDHDAYVVFGIPAVSLTNWPDKFYHTNLDSINKFSPINALKIALTALRAALTFKPDEVPTDYYVGFVKSTEYFSLPPSLYRARQNLYERRETCKAVKELAGYPSPQYLLRKVRDPEIRKEVRKFLNKASWAVTAYIIASLYSSCGLDLSEIKKSLVAELGVKVEESDLNTILKSIELLRNAAL
ncbi:MAG: M28 family peptidase, partial [Thermoprotei archaeon]